jgi:hypothetical protein
LSKILQTKTIDLSHALGDVNDCVSVLQRYRNEESHFDRLFEDATAAHGEEVHMPRSSSRCVYKNNAPAQDARVL